jgi:hypothetical protein
MKLRKFFFAKTPLLALVALAASGCNINAPDPTFSFGKSPCADPTQYPYSVAFVGSCVRQQFLKSDGSGQYDLPVLIQAVCSRDPRVFSTAWLGNWVPTNSPAYGTRTDSYVNADVDFTSLAQTLSSQELVVDFDWVALTDEVAAPSYINLPTGSFSTSYLLANPGPTGQPQSSPFSLQDGAGNFLPTGSPSGQTSLQNPSGAPDGISSNFNGDPTINPDCVTATGNLGKSFCFAYAAGQGQRFRFEFPVSEASSDPAYPGTLALSQANWGFSLSFPEQATAGAEISKDCGRNVYTGISSCQNPKGGYYEYSTTGWTAQVHGHYQSGN